jgi:hypothetical protein
MTPAPSRAAQFKTLLRQCAAELHDKQSSDRVQRLATIRLQRRSIRELQLVSLLSGKLSDPSKLLDADARLAEEETKLAPATSGHNVKVTIAPMTLCPRCRCELEASRPSHIVALPVPSPDASAMAAASDTTQPQTRIGGDLDAKQSTAKPKPSNVVELGRNRARDFHRGAPVKVDARAGDPNVGGFAQSPSERDPHPVDQAWPTPPKGDAS